MSEDMQKNKQNKSQKTAIETIISSALPLLFAIFCIIIVNGYISILNYNLASLSALKLGVLASILAVGLYAVFSLPSPRFRRLNNLVLVNLLITLIGAEAILRVMEDELPFSIVEMLPKDARDRLMKGRGMFVADGISGEGMLYSWKPNTSLPELPWVKVDTNGYRNPAVLQSADLVLLGDSVTIAQNSDQDMADLMRANGISALNLGFGGYGPFHHRDAYQKYVLDVNMDHRVVLINFCFCNDITDAQSYERTVRKGGTWRDYLGTTPTRNAFPLNFDPPWIVSILFHLPFKAVQAYRNREASSEDVRIDLPRGIIQASGWSLPPEPRNLGKEDWRPALTAITTIARRAQAVGAQVIVAYYPNLSQIHMPYLAPSSSARNAAILDHQDAVARLSQLARQEGVHFIDYTRPIQDGNAEKVITAYDSDYHPNSIGVEIMTNTVLPVIRSILSE